MTSPAVEVLTSLQAIAASPEVGDRIRRDRRSELVHLGVPTPKRRAIVAKGFTFTTGDSAEVIRSWDDVWHLSGVADVMFTPLDYYRVHLRQRPQPDFWATSRRWVGRVENWAHADDLGRVYSWAMHHSPADVYPDVVAWSRLDDEWHRRVALVSLIHYAGPNSMFLPVAQVLDVVSICVDDQRPTVRKAVGWVLREASRVSPSTVRAFAERHGLSVEVD
jgi:hypothetical protein